MKDYLIIEMSIYLKKIRIIARASNFNQAKELLKLYIEQGFEDIYIYQLKGGNYL
jgi:hypothetical protein